MIDLRDRYIGLGLGTVYSATSTPFGSCENGHQGVPWRLIKVICPLALYALIAQIDRFDGWNVK